MDWDKLRIFHATAQAGSFTRAGDSLGLSQSAVSRQVSALEQELRAPLFHRHARGLLLTEQGELLFRTAQDVVAKIEATRQRLLESREKPIGELRVTTTVGIGANWLSPRLGEFLELYPDVTLNIILSDDELDLGMRQADVAIRVREPVQPDLIRRKLFTMHFHAYASADYLQRHGEPHDLDALDRHRIVAYAGSVGNYLNYVNSLAYVGRPPKEPRPVALTVNNLVAVLRSVISGVGMAVLPDYLVAGYPNLVRVLPQADMPELDCYLVYAEEMKNVARVQAFRDFLVANAQRWGY